MRMSVLGNKNKNSILFFIYSLSFVESLYGAAVLA